MKRETAKRLHDVSSACGEIMAYGHGTSRGQFLADRTLHIVMTHLLLIIGEALRAAERTDSSLNVTIPDLRDIVDTRNRIVHGYDDVNYPLLWDIVQDDIPSLKSADDALLSTDPVDDVKRT